MGAGGRVGVRLWGEGVGEVGEGGVNWKATPQFSGMVVDRNHEVHTTSSLPTLSYMKIYI